MTKKYLAEIKALNGDKIGTQAHGQATFTLTADQLQIKLEMFATPANMQHWAHFHGFPDGEDAQVVTLADDANGDGWLDLPETAPVSGATMVPFDNAPQQMNIPNDRYPVADAKGHFVYQAQVPLADLQKQFKAAFGTTDLALATRVVYIHGVPESLQLPDTVAGEVANYDAHVTLPIAAGKIRAVD